MQVEHSVRVFPLNTDLETSIQQMTAEGWMLLPGVVPVAVYHVVRMQGAQPVIDGTAKPHVAVSIDETKVQILRNGQLIDAE